MMKPINSNIFEKRKILLKELNDVEKPILNRLRYIINCVADACYFDFNYYSIDLTSAFVSNKIINMQEVDFNGFVPKYNYCPSIFIKGKQYYVRTKLPKHWLFENFEKELKMGVEEARAKQIKQSKLIEKAQTKLSRAEWNALVDNLI